MEAQSAEDREIERETRMAERGRQRYMTGLETLAQRGENENASPQKRLTKGALPLVAERLSQDVPAALDGNRNGASIRGLSAIQLLGYERAAFIGLASCWNGLLGADFRRLTMTMGRAVENELFLTEMREADPKAFSKVFKRANKTVRSRKRILKTHADMLGMEFEAWDQQQQMRCGQTVLNAVLLASGVFEAQGDKIALSEEATSFIGETIEYEQWQRPLYEPMTVRPRDWTSAGLKAEEGPYLTDALNRTLSICRHWDRDIVHNIDKTLRSGGDRSFLEALNVIQSTAYRINRTVYDAILWAWELNLGGEAIAKFPESSLVDVPAYPDNFKDLPKPEQRLLAGRIRELKDLNAKIVGRAVAYHSTMATAATLVEEPRFYLPHSLDFRGRVYPIPHFNHQREDYVSAMFEFTDGKALGPRGHYWLAVHLANCGEFDSIHKSTLDARHEWVLRNEKTILECASDPYENTWWMLAAKPFKFLAACVEWAGYVEQGGRFVSHLPIALDGSNSGLQHYAMMLRNEMDAYNVNLCNVPLPQDVYQMVANACIDQVEKDAEAGDENAKRWQSYGVTRKTVKRSVMTYGYSSARYGFSDQLMQDLMQPLADEVSKGRLPEHPFGDFKGQREASRYLAQVIWDGIHAVISGAASGMEFFKAIATALSSEGRPVSWTTPVGFPVIQRYAEYDVARVKLLIYDRAIDIADAKVGDEVTDDGVFRRVRANLRTRATSRLNKRKQRSAVAPNIVHSLDAAHLMLTVLASVPRQRS